MMTWLRRIFVFVFVLLALRYRAYLLDTESQLLYGLLPLFLASFFLFEKPLRGFRWSDAVLAGFLILFGISTVFAQQPFGFFEFTTFYVGALVYWAVRTVDIPKLLFKKLDWQEIFVLVGGAFSVFALVNFSFSPTDRLSGFFHGYESYSFYPNAAALFLLAILPFTVNLCLHKQRAWHGLLVLNSAAFLLTLSRGAYLVVLACVAVAILFSWRKFFNKKSLKKALYLGLAFVFSLGFALGLNQLKTDGLVVSERLLLKDDAGFASVSERLDFWKGAAQMTLDHPWTGVGPGGFAAYYPEYQTNWLALSDHPHNVLLKLSSETGIPAAAAFALFLTLILGAALRRLWKKPEGSTVALFLAVLAMLLHDLIDYNLNFSVLSALFFVLLAILENQNQDESTSQETPWQNGFYWLTALSIAVSFIALWEGAGLVQAQKMVEGFEEDPYDAAVLKYLEWPPLLPFEMAHFEQEADLAQQVGLEATSNSYLDSFPEFKNYHRWLYFKTQLDPSYADELLASNPRNELEYYALYYDAREKNSEDAQAIELLIQNYTQLLSQNEHLTLLSKNPQFAQELCGLYPEELDETCSVFENVWVLEIYKFNQRYGTELSMNSEQP